ncbi:tRNA lysidine(34) synthetase TilS [Caminicella sporogenes]|uniref:tRNA lysidine(34) synthetase TilS n=1 Tax=Caminicella sporogenes TaxID=166485 RepID=UPI00254123D5|nr:tRNA lysidine(34) synthetase TilS [Caminicella sporogenes]WIF95661.1 tRNA lysidine(34) synthetase TilS [Caminicella sporogenes]
MIEKFLNTVNKYNLIEKGEKIVIGVSGGPDSICLLHLLWRIRNEYDLKLFVVHLNHQFRGSEAEEDAEYVKKFSDNLGIKPYIFSIDIASYSKKKGITFEEAGREWRYRLFDDVAKKEGASKIAIAQNKNDQAETILMRLMRGAGLEGLTAIDYKRNEKIIRPLLNITRREIENYCLYYKLNPRIDKTNLETIYTRNKIRLELIPYIEKNFNSNIIDTLCRTADILRDDRDYLNKMTNEIFNEISQICNNGISLDTNKFRTLHISMQRRVIRKAIEKLKGNLKEIGLVHIEKVIELVKNYKVGLRSDLPGHIIVELGYNSINVKKQNEKIQSRLGEFEYSIKIGESVYIKELNSIVESSIISKEDICFCGKNMIFIDMDKVKGDLIIRNRKNGDRFVPLGMKGSKKLKDFFIDKKVPKDYRDRIPIVCDEQGIIWVVGYRMSEKYKINSDTVKVIKLVYKEGCIE